MENLVSPTSRERYLYFGTLLPGQQRQQLDRLAQRLALACCLRPGRPKVVAKHKLNPVSKLKGT